MLFEAVPQLFAAGRAPAFGSDCSADFAQALKPSSHYYQDRLYFVARPSNRPCGVARLLPMLLLLMAPCLALNLVEMKPLAAAMLAKRWATDQAELDQKVGIRDDGVTGVLRFGDDLRRRTEVAKAWTCGRRPAWCSRAAQKGGGRRDGLRYAGQPSHVVEGSTGPNTLAMVKRSPDGWTLNFLLCNPNERDLDVIAAAERETLGVLAAKAPTR